MLVYVRHGETVLNHTDRDKERLRGQLPVPLSKQGEKDAETAADNLSRHLPATPDSFQTSPLVRAQQTSATIGRKLGIQATPNPAFADWDTGAYAGQLVKDVLPKIRKLVNTPTVSTPGGEPLQAYMNRFVPAIRDLVARPGVHLVVGHARGSSLIEGIASPVGGVGGDIDEQFVLTKPNLQPGGIMVVPSNWQVKILNPEDTHATAG